MLDAVRYEFLLFLLKASQFCLAPVYMSLTGLWKVAYGEEISPLANVPALLIACLYSSVLHPGSPDMRTPPGMSFLLTHQAYFSLYCNIIFES